MQMIVDELQWIITPSGWVLCLLYLLCVPYAVNLQIASLEQSTMAAGNPCQTTPVQNIHVSVLCHCTQIEGLYNFIAVRVLIVIWYVLNKVKNSI